MNNETIYKIYLRSFRLISFFFLFEYSVHFILIVIFSRFASVTLNIQQRTEYKNLASPFRLVMFYVKVVKKKKKRTETRTNKLTTLTQENYKHET